MVDFSIEGEDGFGLGARVNCVRCGREREMPPFGKARMPSRLGGDLTVTADTPCEQCGAKRIRITFDWDGDDPDPDERDAPPSEEVPKPAR